ncbi:nucleotidyltransferase domain-containing protein [Candidatus Woesearchaeota archaeon]|nr:nucleotidyltransferase domain-containing protein [Candidatus Woesearchaeota archaeon]
MAKKAPKKNSQPKGVEATLPSTEQLSNEAAKSLEKIKGTLDKFAKKVRVKYEDYTMGIALLPPAKESELKDKINVLVLMDDSDSTKMSKVELQQKLQNLVMEQAQAVDKNLNPEVLLLSELWQACYDAKYDLLQMIAMAAPVFDKGMLAAVKIAEIHKTMVLKKFEKYIVSYVLAGSLTQGRATPESDIDVFIVIDDTDVKKMTRVELKDKLRAIIVGMGIDAGNMTGIKNKLNIQVYIMTDFWDNIKEANPIIFTFLRDGIPFYDRGIFMPWKQLLKMGKVKPSPEAIDMYKSTGDQMLQRMKFKLNEVAMEDAFWATFTPSQAAIMLYGLPPPTPKETPEVMREVFVKKEKLLEDEYVKMLERILKVRKDMEHFVKKDVSGKELDEIVDMVDKYLKRLGKLFEQITEVKEKADVMHVWESTVTVVRDILKIEGIEKVSDEAMVKIFESEVVHNGIIPEKYLRILKDVEKAKKDYDKGKLTMPEAHKVKKDSRELLKFMVEHIQRKRGRELERAKIRVKHGKKFGEILLMEKQAFITHDIDAEQREITKAPINANGSLGQITASNLEELEHALANLKIPHKAFIKEPIFEDLKGIFGKDVEILVNF